MTAIELGDGRTLEPDKRYNLTLQHGAGERKLRNATVRAFQPYLESSNRDMPDEERNEWRYEAEGELAVRVDDEVRWEPQTIGVVLDHVVSAEEVD